MYCSGCGTRIAEYDRFCGVCGSVIEAAEGGVTTAVARPQPRGRPAPIEPPPVAFPTRRRSWLPAALGSVLVLTAGAVAAVVFLLPLGESSEPAARAAATMPAAASTAPRATETAAPAVTSTAPAATETAAPPAGVAPADVLAPVAGALGALEVRLEGVAAAADLPAVAAAAAQLSLEASRAQGETEVLPETVAFAPLLASALEGALEYADATGLAAERLTLASAAAAAEAGDRAGQAFAALAGADPGLPMPASAVFDAAESLVELAEKREARKEQQRAAKAAARSYVQKIDGLLLNSAETRADLGSLIADVQGNRISASSARGRIAAVIAQRQDLQNAVAAVDAPAPFREAARLLRLSIRDSLDDDFAIQGWINAWYDYDLYSYNRFFSEHEQATARASAAKREFVAEYNRVRRRVVGLGPSPAGDRY